MSRRCSVCQHPDRRDIDAQLVEGGRSNRALSQIFVLSEDAIARHKKNHLPKIAVEAATESREIDHHRKLRILEKVLYTVLTRRLKDEDDSLVLRTHGQLLKHYEFELRLGELEAIKAQIEELKEQILEREETR